MRNAGLRLEHVPCMLLFSMSVKQTLIDMKNATVRPYYHLRSWKPVWQTLNTESRRYFNQSQVILSAVQASVVRHLSEDGIAVIHIDELLPGHNLLAEMQDAVKKLEPAAIPNQKKTYLTQLVPLYRTLDPSDPFVRFSLSKEILDTISAYLEMWPKLYYYTLGITNPVATGEAPRQSQRWHRDPEDRKMCKVFVYLTDVDESSGPFIYVKRSTYGHAWGGVYPQKPPHGHYPPDGEVERRIPLQDIKVCTGQAGTVVFADTSGLHKGGYATEKSRIMSTVGFVTQACTRGVFYMRPANFEQISQSLDPIALYALKNTSIANRKWKY